MPPIRSTTAFAAVTALLGLGLWTAAVLGLSHAPAAESWLPRPGLWMLAVVWLALGYALGWMLRPSPGASSAEPSEFPAPGQDVRQMETEQLFLELERLNRLALLELPLVTPRAQRPSRSGLLTPQVEGSLDNSSRT
jgi:hypothetical protein